MDGWDAWRTVAIGGNEAASVAGRLNGVVAVSRFVHWHVTGEHEAGGTRPHRDTAA